MDEVRKTVICTAIRNPFDPLGSRYICEIEPGRSIREIMRDFYGQDTSGYHIEISIDGARAVDRAIYDVIPQAGSSVVFCAVPMGGKGKNPLLIVAMLALMVVAPMAGAAVFGAGTLGGGLLSFGIMTVGGLAISAIAPKPQPDVPGTGSINNSPTYSWEPQGNTLVEGVTLPEVFGTCRVVPPIVSMYISVQDDKQYLNALLALAGHPVDSITSVRINDSPVTDPDTGAVLIQGISLETTGGEVSPKLTQFFEDTRTDVSVGVKLNHTDYTTRTTSGDTLTGFAVTFSLPKGLYYARDDGGLDAQTVKIYVEYKRHSDSTWTLAKTYNKGTTPIVLTEDRWSAGYFYGWWIELEQGTAIPGDHAEGDVYAPQAWVIIDLGSDNPNLIRVPVVWRWVNQAETVYGIGTLIGEYVYVQAATVSPLHRSFWIDGLVPDQYDIRCKLVQEQPSGVRYGNEVWWESFQEVVPDDFIYPGTALLAVRALATDQLSGARPRIDCLLTRSTVPVWTGAAYEAKAADNPAWACYHMLHRAVYKGTGGVTLAASYTVEGVSADRIDYQGFMSWAGWCTERGYSVNLYFDQAMSLRKALDMIGVNGRGCVVQLGCKFTPIVDRVEPVPVQRFLFTVGNIAADSFVEEWLPLTDRANAIEVTYFDADEDYTRQTVTIYAQDYDTSSREINAMQVTLYGCTSRDAAIKYGKFLINSNKYLTLTCSFDADVDSIVCLPGDVVEIAHDVPQWGYSGRVVSATTNTITLDRPVTIQGGSEYWIRVKHSDDSIDGEDGTGTNGRLVTTGAGTYTTITISGAWSQIPALHDLYSFGLVDRVYKPFRVLRISSTQELRRKITCLEYIAEVYEDDATIPEPEVISDLQQVYNLAALEVYRGGSETKVALTWRGYALIWRVFSRKSGSAWSFVREVYNPYCDVGGLDYGVLYEFAVTGTDNPEDGETVSITLRGKIDPPGNVETITVTRQNFARLVEWSEVTDFDLWGYELRVETIGEPYSWAGYPYPGFVPNWTAGELLFKGNARSYVWVYKEAGGYCLHVRAIDVFGNLSAADTTLVLAVGGPDAPEIDSPVFSGPNAILAWSIPASDFAVDYYEIRYGTYYVYSTLVGTTKGTTFSINVTWGGVRRYWVTAYDVAGNAGTPGFVDVNVMSPGQVGTLTPRVIDNNVLLMWTAPTTGSLPIAHYEISRGDVYAASEAVGTVQGTFTAIFEENSGAYVYWVVGIDTAGNQGAAIGIPATVSQPPDYVLLQDWASSFSGTKASAFVDSGVLYAPINITETYTEHFTNNSYDSPQEQVDDGFTAWIMPVPTTSSYTEVFDYGVLIPSLTKITLEVSRDYAAEWGTPILTATLEVSTNGSSWETPVAGFTTMASGFRYVRAVVTVTGTGENDIAAIMAIRLKLDLKQISDAGSVAITSSGQQIDFNKTFLDITSITLTVQGSTALFAIYDFVDVPNPTHFHVYIFDAGGVDRSTVGHTVSWQARGV